MITQLKKKDLSTLRWLVEFRVLSTRQIELLAGSTSRTIQRKMKELSEEDLVEIIERPYSAKRGRPERLFCLGKKGFNYLKEMKEIDESMRVDQIRLDIGQNLDHQIGVNWVLIHAQNIEQFQPLKVRYLLPNKSSQTDNGKKVPLVNESIPDPVIISKRNNFIPDAVLGISDSSQQKTLLFFLEVDRSTESLSGAGNKQGTIRQKILDYQTYFRCSGYKRYEKYFQSKFTGFRLLFVCDTDQRSNKLCTLVHNTPSSDFVWLATEEDILNHGMGAYIWNRGGMKSENPQSILGPTFAFDLVNPETEKVVIVGKQTKDGE